MNIKSVLEASCNEITLTKQEFENLLEEQKELTFFYTLELMKKEIVGQIDINWQQGLLQTIDKYQKALKK